MHATAHVGRSEDHSGEVVWFHHVGSRDWTLVTGVSDRLLYPLSYLNGLVLGFDSSLGLYFMDYY